MAVFLSLFLGILIGGALFQDSALVEEQGLLITQMETRFRELQANLSSLQQELDFSHEAWQAIRDLVFSGQMLNKTVVLVTKTTDEFSSLIEALELAGADLKTLSFTELAGVSSGEDLALILPLTDQEPDGPSLEQLGRLLKDGAQVAYVSRSVETPFSNDFSEGLYIDHVDTVFGEIALVLGLAKGSRGQYSFQAGAVGFSP